MNRRKAILTIVVVLGMAPLAVPRWTFAQKNARIRRIGFISAGNVPLLDAFRQGMRDLGYEVGKDYVVESKVADGRYERLPALAADLVNRDVDVIVGIGTPAIRAIKRATSSIPIVMALVGDPVASGLVASLARPSGNVTGLSLATTDISTKWLELAMTVAPRSSIGVLANADESTAKRHVQNIQNAAQRLGIGTSVVYAQTVKDIENAFASLADERVGVAIVLPGSVFFANAKQLAQAAIRRRIALIGDSRGYVERGALLSYGQDYRAFVRRAATYVDRIFKGAKPSDLPVEQPLIFELVLNPATARQLDLSIPKDLLLRADAVIE